MKESEALATTQQIPLAGILSPAAANPVFFNYTINIQKFRRTT